MSKILEKARHEEEARRKTSYAELTKLADIVKAQGFIEEIAPATNYRKDVIKSILPTVKALLKTDQETIAKLNEEIKVFNPHPALKFNKLTEIFKCTEEIIDNDLYEALEGTLLSRYPIDQNSKTILYGAKDANENIINYSGTSKPNCIQNTYLLVLRALTDAKTIQDIQKLHDSRIYEVENSPNIQTTKLPDNFNNSAYKSWFYFYQDEESPTQGELLVPHLGYAFGGSRADSRYKDKIFKSEDCSSAVAKWLGATEPFITTSMKAVHENSSECDNFCKSAKAVLTPVVDKETGYIFFFPGHTGVVTNVYPNEELFETLSYSRDMTNVEGLGYKNYSYTEKAFLFFQEKVLVSSDQELIKEEL